MKPLFTTNVATLQHQIEKLIAELEYAIASTQNVTLALAKQCNTFDELQKVVRADNSSILKSRLDQYEDDLAYLYACEADADADAEVSLDKTEWKHYFKGAVRPELC